MEAPAASRTLETVRDGQGMEKGGGQIQIDRPEGRGRLKIADVAQGRLIAKFVLSCAGANGTSLAVAYSRVNLWS